MPAFLRKNLVICFDPEKCCITRPDHFGFPHFGFPLFRFKTTMTIYHTLPFIIGTIITALFIVIVIIKFFFPKIINKDDYFTIIIVFPACALFNLIFAHIPPQTTNIVASINRSIEGSPKINPNADPINIIETALKDENKNTVKRAINKFQNGEIIYDPKTQKFSIKKDN